jgi:hypothetical protein
MLGDVVFEIASSQVDGTSVTIVQPEVRDGAARR